MIGGSTRVVALLGDPVAHSLSPRIQNAAMRAARLDAVYVAIPCSAAHVAGLLRGLAWGGGAGNVTVPHKAEAAKLVDDPGEAVVETGACNTFWLEGGRIRGENTDVTGFRGAVRSLLGRGAEGMRVLLRGAGGAARGALFALIQDGVDEVVLWNRTPERAERIAEGMGAGVARVARSATELGEAPFDLVVNATSLGLGVRDPLPVDPERLRDPGALLDLVYQPAETELVRRARELGIPAADGGEMLVLQGAAAFELWWGRAAPLAVMREALAQARGEIAGVAGA